jgi:hypothetical protein
VNGRTYSTNVFQKTRGRSVKYREFYPACRLKAVSRQDFHQT